MIQWGEKLRYQYIPCLDHWELACCCFDHFISNIMKACCLYLKMMMKFMFRVTLLSSKSQMFHTFAIVLFDTMSSHSGPCYNRNVMIYDRIIWNLLWAYTMYAMIQRGEKLRYQCVSCLDHWELASCCFDHFISNVMKVCCLFRIWKWKWKLCFVLLLTYSYCTTSTQSTHACETLQATFLERKSLYFNSNFHWSY